MSKDEFLNIAMLFMLIMGTTIGLSAVGYVFMFGGGLG